MDKKKIMVVEDEAIIALYIQHCLQNLGYEVVNVVGNGEAAVVEAANLQPDLILMDIVLKGEMDGVQAAGHIRRQLDIPVIFLTAYADDNTLQRAKITQPYGYVVKPFEEQELRAALEIAFFKQQADAELRYRLELEKLIAAISTNFINLETGSVGNEISRTLQAIGEFIQADRSYVFLFAAGGLSLDKSYEWRTEGVGSHLDKLLQAPPEQYPWSVSRLKQFQNVYIPQVTELPHEAAAEQKLLVSEGIQTFLAIPMVYNNNLVGMIGFDCVRAERDWSDESIMLLKFVGEIFTNAIERQRMEQQLRHQERLAAVGQLASGIAHDFNNILAAIVLYTQLLQRTSNLSPKDQQRLAIIYSQTQYAAHLVTQILDFSRQSVMELEPIDFITFLDKIGAILENDLPDNITFDVVYEAPGENQSYSIRGDATRLEQVIMNLVANAREAMPSGGQLQIKLAPLHLAVDQIPPLHRMDPGDWLRLSISDSGSGVPGHIQSHIFEPFFTTKPPGQGVGLGLAQVYGIIRQHGGYVTLDQQIEQGATFIIYLPALTTVRPASQPASLPEMNMPWPAADRERPAILYVEDDRAMREAVTEILELWGYHVITAVDGLDALNIVSKQEQEINLVLSDMVMPRMDGVELYQVIKKQWPAVKMIIVSGFPLTYKGKELLEQGITDWIQKPFAIDELALKVKAALTS